MLTEAFRFCLVDNPLYGCHPLTNNPRMKAKEATECQDNTTTEQQNEHNEEETPLSVESEQPAVVSLIRKISEHDKVDVS